MGRTLRLGILLAVLAAALPYPAAADDIAVSFTVVEESPVSVTIRATITGADSGLPVTARIEQYGAQAKPTVQGIQVAGVERVAEYRHTPEYETKRIPIAEKVAALEAEAASLGIAPKGESDDAKTMRREQRDVKWAEVDALLLEQAAGATFTEEQVVVAHRYETRYRERLVPVASMADGATVLLPTQSWAEPPPGKLIADTELALEPVTVNWDGAMVYEYTIQTGETRAADGGYGSAGILVLTINGRDYYDDTHSSWWSTSWPYRMKLTIDNSGREALLDFPLMVKLTPERFDYSFSQVDGDDIRFVDADGTALDYECDTWTLDGDSWFWVRVPQIDADSDTDYIWMYWGTAAVGNGEDAEGVWPTDTWVAVYHMNDDSAGTGILDSTANGNDGTKGTGAAAPIEVAGTIGQAQQFVKSDARYVICPSAVGSVTGDVTLMCVAAWRATEIDACLMGARTGVNNYYSPYRFMGRTDASARQYFYMGGGYGLTSWALVDMGGVLVDEYQMWTASVAGTVMQGYRDDVAWSATGSFAGVRQSGVPLTIGQAGSGAYAATADITEARVAQVAFSANWIAADYASMWDILLTYGDAEGIPEPEEEPVAPILLPEALLCVGLAIAAVKQKHIILYVAAFFLLLVTGFGLIETALPLGVMTTLFAVYMLWGASDSILHGGR